MTEPKQTKSNRLANHLSRKQREAIPHLIGARSLEEGREKAKVSKSTLYEWLKDQNFKAELDRTRERVISDALNRLKQGVATAVENLTELMNADSLTIRIRACERVIDFYFRQKELDLEDRISQLEKNLAVYNERSK